MEGNGKQFACPAKVTPSSNYAYMYVSDFQQNMQVLIIVSAGTDNMFSLIMDPHNVGTTL